MEVYQPLDFSSNSGPLGAMLLSPTSPSGLQGGLQDGLQGSLSPVLDLSVHRSSPLTSPCSPRSPRSPASPLYHPYHHPSHHHQQQQHNNNNNIKSVNHNDVNSPYMYHSSKTGVDGFGRSSLPSPPAYPHAELPEAGQVTTVPLPALSVLQQRLLPRSATSAFAPTQPSMPTQAAMPTVPAPRTRRTSSGLPDSPLGSTDDRSSSAASLSPSPPGVDLLGPLGPLATLGPQYPTVLAELSAASSMQAAMPPVVSGATAAARNGKPTRPFKAYPKDPLSLAVGVQVGGSLGSTEAALGRASNEAYAEFRRRMLAQVQAAIPSKAKKGDKPDQPSRAPSPTQQMQPADSLTSPHEAAHGSDTAESASSPESLLPTTLNTQATSPSAQDKDGKDAAYWERRRKNNEAAKRSRDARRAKEDEIAIRAAFLEQENLNLKYEVAALRNETAKLRVLLYSGGTDC
ncbi:protein giant [Frankliniella occidentalis]|uniref:Protein giant n=1 Tax=Frankliniella occidentalis TaxID=133901 RepID=A0A6J1TRQ0_FRAOC|nr:protein giant [Frankliniella occidentalis]